MIKALNIFMLLALTMNLNSLGQEENTTLNHEEISMGCLNVSMLSEEYVINSEKEFYSKLSRAKVSHPQCGDFEAPIDFDKKTLIGIGINLGGCANPIIETKVSKSSEGIIICSLIFQQNGNCRRLFQQYTWFSIDKTPKNKIQFERIKNEK